MENPEGPKDKITLRMTSNLSKREYFAAAVIQGYIAMHANLNTNTLNVEEVIRNTLLITDKLLEKLACKDNSQKP